MSECGTDECFAREIAKSIAKERELTDSKFERVFSVFQQSQTEQTAALKELISLNMQSMNQHVDDIKGTINDLKSSVADFKKQNDNLGEKIRGLEANKLNVSLKDMNGDINAPEVLSWVASCYRLSRKSTTYVIGGAAIFLFLFMLIMSFSHTEQTIELIKKVF